MNFRILSKDELNCKLEEFSQLSRICFTAYVDREIIRQRYIENPYGDLLMCIAEEEGKIIANYSAVPLPVLIEGNRYKAALSINTMTHPEYEGRGLVVRLASLLYEHMLKENYSFVCGFPNYLSNGILCAKLGWKDVCEIPTLELEIKADRRNDCIEGLRTDDWIELNGDVSQIIRICKEEKYLKWRYKENKTNTYKLIRFSSDVWCIYHVFKTEINITEFHYTDLQELKSILEYLINVATENNLKKITTWSPINTEEHLFFERYGFRSVSPVRYFGIKSLAYNGMIDIFDARNWRVFMGDDNVY